jgi:hypothetical protein
MPENNPPPFDEQMLRADVIKMWGEAGAHIEVLDHLIGLASKYYVSESFQKYPELRNAEGIFVHQCITPGCGSLVEYDDEPCCFKHSPDEGSHLAFYSVGKRLREGIIPNPTA